MKNVFYSQPFHGRTEEEIFQERKYLKTLIKNVLKDDVVIIDQYHQEISDDTNRGWYMVNDLIMILKSDYVVFAPTWKKSAGCRIEMDFCKKYGINFIKESWLEKMKGLL